MIPVIAGATDHVINIPALSFVGGNASITYERNAADWGNLTDADGQFYAAVPFSHLDRSVCSFTLYVRDFDATQDARARLLRKPFGTASTFTVVTQMADVMSAGASDSMRAFTTTAINRPEVLGGYINFRAPDLGVRIYAPPGA